MFNMAKRNSVSCLWQLIVSLILWVIITVSADQTRLETSGGALLHGHPMAHHLRLVLHWHGILLQCGLIHNTNN